MPEIKIMLGDILKDRNMTQTELVKLTGIRSETISNLSRGKIEKPSLEHLAKIMNALEITDTNEILKYDDNHTKPTTEIKHDPLDDEITMIDLPPAIFNAIKKHKYGIMYIRELAELDFSRIRRIGPKNREILESMLNEYLEKHR